MIKNTQIKAMNEEEAKKRALNILRPIRESKQL